MSIETNEPIRNLNPNWETVPYEARIAKLIDGVWVEKISHSEAETKAFFALDITETLKQCRS